MGRSHRADRRETARPIFLHDSAQTTRGLAVQQILDAGLTVYPVMPKAAARYRERKAPGGSKDDQLDDYRTRIAALFATHPQSSLFGSLPGAAEKLAPRLLSLVLMRVQAGVSVAALQSLAGTAPVTYRSGQVRKCYIRRLCDKALRCAVHLWANECRRKCAWAESCCEAHRAKGQSHASALRCPGQRWLKILHAMCVNGTPYHEAKHLQAMTKHGSWNLRLTTGTTPKHPGKTGEQLFKN